MTALRAGAGVALLMAMACGDEPLQGPPHPECFALADPYAAGGSWHRANFHMHSKHSDGALFGSKLVELYGQNGYSVLCMSDHNQYGDQDGGVVAEQQADSTAHDWNGDGIVHPRYEFGSGAEAYVRDWRQPPPPWAMDPWTRPEPADWTTTPVVIPGAEATYQGFHIGLVGHPGGRIESPGAAPGYWHRTRRAGGFIFLAHPGEWNAAPQRLGKALDLRSLHAIEIANGLRLTKAVPGAAAVAAPADPSCAAILPWDATPLWDGLLARGYRLWGMGNDDAHTWVGAPDSYPFAAFDMVLTSDPTEQGFLSALHRGAFYASTGLYFIELGVQKDEIAAWAPGAKHIRFLGWGGRVLLEVDGDRARYRPAGGEGYVRIEATGEPAQTPWAPQAWSQPFWIEAKPCAPGADSPRGEGG